MNSKCRERDQLQIEFSQATRAYASRLEATMAEAVMAGALEFAQALAEEEEPARVRADSARAFLYHLEEHGCSL